MERSVLAIASRTRVTCPRAHLRDSGDRSRHRCGTSTRAAYSGVVRSVDGSSWELPTNAPQSVAVIGDGDRMFASWNVNGKCAYWAATESSGADWTSIAAPPVASRGENFALDRDHHVLYAAHRTDGIWRMVTKK